MLDGMHKINLKIIKAESGSVMHFLNKDDLGFVKFEEVYFSTVHKDSIKAWKMHKKMILNLVVPNGRVLFAFVDLRKDSKTFNKTYKIVLSQNPYFRLTVPPLIWFGFKGLDHGSNMICNCANIIHDPDEVVRKDINDIKIDWSI